MLGLALASCNLAQFAVMIKQKTGKSALAYNGYGCYCGWGGSKQPLDATDRYWDRGKAEPPALLTSLGTALQSRACS